MKKIQLSNFREKLLAQQKQIRRDFKTLARLFPGAFDEKGIPIIAELRFPPK